MSNNDNQDRQKTHHRPWGHHDGSRRMDLLDRKMGLLNRMRFGQRGFLRPQIIQLFEERPMNGVDIMSKLQEMSQGWYRPSPGAIYPLLEQLGTEGVIAKNKDGKFELTAAYAKQAGIRDSVGRSVSAIESNVSYLEDLQRTDAAKLSKYKNEVVKLLKRLEALTIAIQSVS